MNRKLFLDEFDVNEEMLAQAKQISSDGVRIVDKPGKYADCDAMITDSNDVFLSVLTADCSPVLIWSNDYPVVAAVHSGWSGSELDILGKTISTLSSRFEIEAASLNMVIGPGLSRENFEVGPEFQEKFPAKYLHSISGSTHFKFDNNQYLIDSAKRCGLREAQIEVLNYCSYKDEELFFSHRRDEDTTGRMISVIGIKK